MPFRRRSTSLPGDEAARLLDEVERLRRDRRDLEADLDALADQIGRLRSRLGHV
jgi:hypothetical protein